MKDLQKVSKLAMRSAINKVLRQAKTLASKELRTVYRLKKVDIDRGMSLKLARGNDFTGTLEIGGKKLKLAIFPHRQLKVGVKVTIIRQAPKKIPGSFIAVLSSGHEGIFKRKGSKRIMTKGRYKGKLREPIVELVGPSIPQLFAGQKIIPKLKALVREKLPETFQHEFEFYLAREPDK